MSTPDALFAAARDATIRRTDRVFLWLLLAQWALAITLALILTPYSWTGAARVVHFHVKVAIGFGALINALPIALIATRPGWWLTRHVIAVVQILWSAVLVMLTGGRIETHFHIFGSLAFLAFYRDPRVLGTATAVIVADHLLRGLYWPDSVYGLANPEWWRFLEHAAWVAFEDVVLVIGCHRQLREMWADAEQRAALEQTNARIEEQVQERIQAQRKLEVALWHAQKLESVGRLAAGVAHEINTPIQYVTDSVEFVRETVDELFGVLAQHRAATAREQARGAPEAEAAMAADAALDTGYLATEYPGALDRALEGLGRVTAIVRSMHVFAHPERERASIDVNATVASTLAIARHEYKYVADLTTDLGELPQVTCHAGELGQVVLNLVINAAHAIEDVVGDSGTRGRITVSTHALPASDAVEIVIADTGAGIPDAIRERIFDPFFTTKPVGRGTGQGLAMAHSVIVEGHGGAIAFDSTVGHGTTFRVRLPIAPPAPPRAELAA